MAGLFNHNDTDEYPVVYYNTGTIFDLMTGEFVRGVDGKWYIAGGLCNHITGNYAAGNCFKTTFGLSLIGRSAAIYAGSEVEVLDTEGAHDFSGQRLLNCAGELGKRLDLKNVSFRSGVTTTLGKMTSQLEAIGEHKLKNKKDFTIETPFIDPRTGKAVIAWLPTFYFPDSFSEVLSGNELSLLKDEGIEGKKTKTIFLVDGQQKTIFLRHLRRFCEMYGLVVYATCQVGSNVNMDSMSPVSKKTQFMKQDQALKAVGAKFYYLTRTLFELSSPTILQKDKQPEYGSKNNNIPYEDRNEVLAKVIRGKSNRSGIVFPLVFSQTMGLLNSLTSYHYLRRNNYFGLTGNMQNHACSFNPDVKLSRNTASDVFEVDPQEARAMELMLHFAFLKHFMPCRAEVAKAWEMTPEELWGIFQSVDSPMVSDILNSRSFWCPPGAHPLPYLSIMDVLELVSKNR